MSLVIKGQIGPIPGMATAVATATEDGFQPVHIPPATPLDCRYETALHLRTRQPQGLLLVVDDSAVERAVTASRLERAGYKVVLASDGRQAVDIVLSFPLPFDAVVMDVSMPELDGIEATRRIRTMNGPRRRVPIIALTGNTAPEDRDKCLDAGMNAYLTKPLAVTELLEAVAEHIAAAAMLQPAPA